MVQRVSKLLRGDNGYGDANIMPLSIELAIDLTCTHCPVLSYDYLSHCFLGEAYPMVLGIFNDTEEAASELVVVGHFGLRAEGVLFDLH